MRRDPPQKCRARPTGPLRALALAVLTLAPHALAQAGPPGASASADGDSPAALLAVLTDPRIERVQRDDAADKLVADAGRPAVARDLTDILRKDEERGGARTALVNAIARSPEPAVELLRPLIDLVGRTQPGRRSPMLAALGSFRWRDAARTLVENTGPDAPAADRAAAIRALVRMTGRDDLNGDAAAWKDWLEGTRDLSPREWRAALAPGLARHADRLRNDRDAAVERLIDASRRLYLATPEDARDAFLASLMLDGLAEVRSLGFELVSRGLSAGTRTFSPVVTDAALALLADPDPSVRADAALLVNQLAPPAGGPVVAEALLREHDPRAAASLLQALARWPDSRLAPTVIAWVQRDSDARPAAFAALFALHRAGMVSTDQERAAALAALRSAPTASLSVPAMRLLLAIGDESDRAAIAGLLASGDAGVRLLAADALADRPEFVDQVLDAARRDPALFDAAVRACVAHRPTAVGFAALRPIAAPTPEAHRAGLIRAASVLPVAELLAAAIAMPEDPDLREQILSLLTNPPEGGRPASPPGDTEAKALVLLARTRLALGRPEGALAALSLLPPTPAPEQPGALAARTAALLWLNRVTQAEELDAPASAWIDGLELASAEPHAPALAQLIRERFGDQLTTEEATRLDQITALIESWPEREPPH